MGLLLRSSTSSIGFSAVADAENGALQYGYDGLGNVTSRSDGRGVTTTWTYNDLLDRLAAISCSGTPGAPAVTLAYDTGAAYARGRLVSVSSSNATSQITGYDVLGRITGSSESIAGASQSSYSFSYGWNLADALVSMTYPSGRTLTMTMDAANRVASLTGTYTGAQKTYVTGSCATNTAICYAPHGDFASHKYGNQVARSYTWNSRLQPGEWKDTLPGVTNPLLNLQYSYAEPVCHNTGTTANGGNVTQLSIGTQTGGTAANFTQSYGYDCVNRLASASESGAFTQNFGYDRYGNMWLSSSSGLPSSLTALMPSGSSAYNTATNRLAAAGYDAAGNHTGLGGNTIGYDAEGRQTSYCDSVTGNTWNYAWDGTGQRVKKWQSGASTAIYYVHDAFGNLAVEYNTGTVSPACTACFVSWDHLGSTRMVTDGTTGQPVARHDYVPFGGEIPAGNAGRIGSALFGAADGVTAKFTGKERDAESGLDFFGARYFSAAQGRFTSPDWSEKPEAVPYADLRDPQSLNLYGYVRNNPLKNRDPDGHICVFGIGNTCTTVPAPPPPKPPSLPKDVPYTNLPGPRYKTVDAAGKSAVTKINPKSIEENREYGGRVVRNVNNTYGVTEPIRGTADGSENGPVPDGTAKAAIYHTHGAFDSRYDNENFSPRDKSTAKEEGTPTFVGTPSGAIKKFDPATGRVIDIVKGENER